MRKLRAGWWCVMMMAAALCLEAGRAGGADDVVAGRVKWRATGPLLSPLDAGGDHYHSVKDPTVVFHDGWWHVFVTVRGVNRSHQIEHIQFRDWSDTAAARRTMLTLSDGYFCAPQVFYFQPHRKWYMIVQVTDPSRKPALQPAFSTTEHLDDPASWTKPALLYDQMFAAPSGFRGWIDFWVICDDTTAHLFFTSNDGRMWRAHTKLADFPRGWSPPALCLSGDVFEASHTYRLGGNPGAEGGKYLTIIEAVGEGGRRYYKSYVADALDGEWKPVNAARDDPFAGPSNVRFEGQKWTDSFSHGELLRASNDQTLTVNPRELRFVFQGVSDADRTGKKYGEIPWRLGLLEME